MKKINLILLAAFLLMGPFAFADCYQMECPIFVDINKSQQKMSVYIKGRLTHRWSVSTGSGGIRLLPQNAKIFLELTRQIGFSSTWVSVHD